MTAETKTQLRKFLLKNYVDEYSEEANEWGYKHKERGWRNFGNVYTHEDVVNDFYDTFTTSTKQLIR